MDSFDPRNSERFEDLWEAYSRQLLAFIRSRVSDEADAEDLLQEVFLRIHTHLCCLPELGKIKSWVYQITRNAIIDYYRARRPHEELPETLADEAEATEEEPAEVLAPSLRQIVEELPGRYREALLLTEYEGFNQRELAEKLGISVPGAKSRVQRARQMIRDMLLACCHFELDRRGRIIDYYARCCCCSPVE
jgi:RNA polymerase sigma-70 factor (ECF subfamily)